MSLFVLIIKFSLKAVQNMVSWYRKISIFLSKSYYEVLNISILVSFSLGFKFWCTFYSTFIHTMRQKFSNFFNPNFFMIKYAKGFAMLFVGRVIHNFNFHFNHFARFSYVHGLPRDVSEIMPIMCHAFHVQLMLSKFALSDSYMYQNK